MQSLVPVSGRQKTGRSLFLLLYIVVTLLSLPAVTSAQEGEGEFQIIRSALRERFDLRMSLVADWDWEQVNFDQGVGIESCIAEATRQGVNAPWGRVYKVEALNGVVYEVRISFDQNIVVVCDNDAAPVAPPPAPTEVPAGETPAEAAPAADAPPAAVANLPPPVASSAVSSGFFLGGHVQDMSASTFGLMQRAGMTWVKKQVRFGVGDSPANVADIINVAHGNGYRVLLGIVGRTDQMHDYPGYINAYSQYVAGVAALGADAIEVWNEPNIDREWPAAAINGGTYTQLLAGAYNAIKAANPNTLVISGAPAPTGYFGAAGCGQGGCNDDVFMQQMADAGAARYMDCVGLHYNEGIIAPSQTSGDPRGSYPTYYFGSMLQRGYGLFGGKPVCFTELGYLSGEGYTTPIPPHFGWANATTVPQHAAWLAEAATIAARSGKVRIMIVWNVDFSDFTAGDPMGGYAMQRPGSGCPACDTLGAVMR